MHLQFFTVNFDRQSIDYVTIIIVVFFPVSSGQRVTACVICEQNGNQCCDKAQKQNEKDGNHTSTT